MKRKKILGFLLLIMMMLIPFNVEAKDYKIMFSYFSNGGTVASGNVEIISGVIFEKGSTKSDITYTSNQTVKYINSLDGTTQFTLKKGSSQQTRNKEWYAENYLNGKKIYFSNSKSYTVKDIVKKLNLDTAYNEETGVPLEIYLQANFAKEVSVKSIELNTSYKAINKGESFKLTPVFYPSNASDKTVTWSSEDSSIATVDSKGNVKGIKGGVTKIVAVSTDGNKVAKCRVTVHDSTTIKVTGIKLNKSNVSLQVGKSTTVTATVTPSNATNKTVTWKSSNTKVATVTNGKITGKAKGTATITATTTDGAKTAKVKVTVSNNKVTGIKLSIKEATIKVGETITISETIEPSNATNKAVTWKSSNTKIATVDSKGKVKGVKKGTATITATTKDGNKKASAKITVTEKTTNNTKVMLFVGNSKTSKEGIPKLTEKIASSAGYKVEAKSITKGGATLQTIANEKANELKATKYDYLILQEQTDSYLRSDTSLYKSGVNAIINNTNGNTGSKKYIRALWGLNTTQQSDLNIAYKNTKTIADSVGAKVIYDGKAWDLSKKRNRFNLFSDIRHQSKYGAYLSALTTYATIYDKSPIGIKYYGKLTKTEATELQKVAHEVVFGTITVTPKSSSLQLGKTKQLKVTTSPETKVSWKSSNTSIATVNSSGVVLGKKEGTVKITATANKTSDTVTIKVEKVDILTQNTLNIYKTRYFDLKLFVHKNIGTVVTWSSENKSLAEVSKTGIVHALKDGTVNIVAKTSRGEEKIKLKITTQTNNKKYNLASCSSMDVKSTGTKVKLYNCIPDVQLSNPITKKRYQIQKISISDNYVYYSSPMNGCWLSEAAGTINNTDDATTKLITTVYIARVPRSGTEMKYMQVEYAGHGQGLDTAGLSSEGKELLYMNIASKFRDYTQLLSGRTVRGTDYRGIAITTFGGKTDQAALRHPGTVITIDTKNVLHKRTTAEFQSNGKLNETAYYNFLKSTARNENLIRNPETSVDDINHTVAVRGGTRVLIYKESEFRKGKGSPIYEFRIEDGGTQGDDIYGNYFYTITGATDATIKKYDIRTGKKVAEAAIDFTEFLKDNAYVNMEPEGISFNNGKLYAGIVTRACGKYEGNSCKSGISYNTIVKITGI